MTIPRLEPDKDDIRVDEEAYKSRLSAETLEVARAELNEEPAAREEGLRQVRQWVRSQPAIKRCRLDDNFLLRFLRMQKYDVTEACDILDKYLTMRCQYPSWFQNLDCKEPAMSELVELGYILALPGRDKGGRRVIFSRAAAMDPAKFTASDMMRAHIMTFETLLQDEENQVRGFTYIFDEKDVSLSHLSIWTPTEVSKAFNCCEKALPMRHREIHFLHLPWTMALIFQFAKNLLSEKIRNRFQTHGGVASLTRAIGAEVLPAEYGGTAPSLAECVGLWRQELDDNRQALVDLDTLKVSPHADHLPVSRKKSRHDSGNGLLGVMGSLRKMELQEQ